MGSIFSDGSSLGFIAGQSVQDGHKHRTDEFRRTYLPPLMTREKRDGMKFRDGKIPPGKVNGGCLPLVKCGNGDFLGILYICLLNCSF